MITQSDLVQRLIRRNPSAWSVAERDQDIAIADDHHRLRRREHVTRFTLIVHQDVPLGRGSARLDIDTFDGSADDLIDQALSLAIAAVGPAWSSSPSAAPANVAITDPDLLRRDLDTTIAGILDRLHRPTDTSLVASIHALREQVTVIASSGFHASYLATALRADARLALPAAPLTNPRPPTYPSLPLAASTNPPRPDARPSIPARPTPRASSAPSSTARSTTSIPGRVSTNAPDPGTTTPVHLQSTTDPPPPFPTPAHSLRISRTARRIGDLRLDTAIADAASDLLNLTLAIPPDPGRCAVWLGPDALLPPHGDDHGIWAIFAHQADATVERQGLTRYRLHTEIAPGAAQLAEPVSILSNGALDFATRSIPVADDAVAIRNFPLVERGIAVGLGLSPREAALRGADPNGGVRNLVVPPGTWLPAPSLATRTIEVRHLHNLSIDLTTGTATLDIALGFQYQPNRPEPVPFTGGTLHLDLIPCLARARRSSQLLRRGAYHGPASILIDDVELLP